jgi:hydrogenase maturation protein HypF
VPKKTVKPENPAVHRRLIRIRGIVQGVGFRPFVFRLASEEKISGHVYNDDGGVLVDAQAELPALERFCARLQSEPPPLARIDGISWESAKTTAPKAFSIARSPQGKSVETVIPPDAATCVECRREIMDAANRRYAYAFTNCTNCGPRLTIIAAIPYDRPATTMGVFTMCPQCQAEYDNPHNRRFHAQPNACPQCGPKLWLEDKRAKKSRAVHPLAAAARSITRGEILAVRGLGGFHLVCDATNERAVGRLRQRKQRPTKPLAIMVADLPAAEQFVAITPAEAQLLQSYRAPIVLMRRRQEATLAANLAPGNPDLGVMLPATPLHHLLLRELQELTKGRKAVAIVATSANRSEEPICISNDDARSRLSEIADLLLVHNREILIRNDDSVVKRIAAKNILLRRSRGYVPRPLPLPGDGLPLLAVGAELKNTIAIGKRDEAYLSQHIGELNNALARDFFLGTIAHMQKITSTTAAYVVADMHPAYLSRRWAEADSNLPLISVQHHHAHMAAAMAEYGLREKTLAFICDGTGYGYDGNIWGGEILYGDYCNVERLCRLRYMPIAGADQAVRNPWRLAAAYCDHAGIEALAELPPFKDQPIWAIAEMLKNDINIHLSSSCGRLFDVVSALAGGPRTISFEGEAAIAMMQQSLTSDCRGQYTWQFQKEEGIIDFVPMLTEIISDVKTGASLARVGRKFHNTLTQKSNEAILHFAREKKCRRVILSGGVWQNEILLEGLWRALSEQKMEVLIPERAPLNDGGIAYGQLAVARGVLQAGLPEVNYVDATAALIKE